MKLIYSDILTNFCEFFPFITHYRSFNFSVKKNHLLANKVCAISVKSEIWIWQWFYFITFKKMKRCLPLRKKHIF